MNEPRRPVWPQLVLGFVLAISAVLLGQGAGDLRAQAPGPGVVLRGGRAGVLGPVRLHAGLVVVRARSNGTQNFAVDLKTQDRSKPLSVAQDPGAFRDYYALINTVGRVDGAAAAFLAVDDDYYVDVTLASGPFELVIEQPEPAKVNPVAQADFAGKGQQVTPYFTLSAGTYTVTAQTDSYGLRAWLYALDDLGGAPVASDLTGYYGTRLLDTTIPPGYTSVPITVPTDGVYVLYVDPQAPGSLEWTIAVH